MNIPLIDNSLNYKCCPLCKSDRITSNGNLSYYEKIYFSSQEIRLKHRPELMKCQNCQSSFVHNAIHEETAKGLYSLGQAGERWSTEIFEKHKHPNVIKSMAKIFSSKGNILDIGCNTGVLLDFARSFGCKTSGVEFSETSREILVEKGHAAYSSFDETPGGFDIITSYDLIEHLYDVPAFLELCQKKLNKNGKLVILTGNIGSLSARLTHNRWWYLQYPEHIVFPSKKYFKKYSGFKIKKWIYTYASIGYKQPVFPAIIHILKSVIKGTDYLKKYTGLPSLGPDHILIVLGN